MVITTRVVAVDDSLGVILPQAVLERLQLKPGDELVVSTGPDSIHLRIMTPNLKAELDAYTRATEPYQDVLQALADDDQE